MIENETKSIFIHDTFVPNGYNRIIPCYNPKAYGRKMSAETKKKISEKLMGRTINPASVKQGLETKYRNAKLLLQKKYGDTE